MYFIFSKDQIDFCILLLPVAQVLDQRVHFGDLSQVGVEKAKYVVLVYTKSKHTKECNIIREKK